jgi:hypothetical protein
LGGPIYSASNIGIAFEDRIWFGPFLLLGGFKPFALVNAISFIILFLQSIIDDRLVLLLFNTLNIPNHELLLL